MLFVFELPEGELVPGAEFVGEGLLVAPEVCPRAPAKPLNASIIEGKDEDAPLADDSKAAWFCPAGGGGLAGDPGARPTELDERYTVEFTVFICPVKPAIPDWASSGIEVNRTYFPSGVSSPSAHETLVSTTKGSNTSIYGLGR